MERMFARLKKWEILSGGLVDSIDTKEMELDCAMALQNLIERFKLGLGASSWALAQTFQLALRSAPMRTLSRPNLSEV